MIGEAVIGLIVMNIELSLEENNLKSICRCNFSRLVLAHLNINSIRNKFDSLTQQITGTVDILMISETKLDK